MSDVSKSMRRPLRQDMRAFKKIRQNESADIRFLAAFLFGATRIGVVLLCSAIEALRRRLEPSRKLRQASELRACFTDVNGY